MYPTRKKRFPELTGGGGLATRPQDRAGLRRPVRASEREPVVPSSAELVKEHSASAGGEVDGFIAPVTVFRCRGAGLIERRG